MSPRRPVRLAAALSAVLLAGFAGPAFADHGPGGGDDGGHGGGQQGGQHGGQQGGGQQGGGQQGGHGGHSLTSIPLPNGFSPEDITAGPHHTFYVGSLVNGAIYQGSFRSSYGHVLVPSATGPTTGLYLEDRENQHGNHGDNNDDRHGSKGSHGSHGDRLWAAGGPSGQARVYDADTGTLLHTWQLADPSSGSFISDVVVTRWAAYYTDAFRPQMYVIPLHGAHAGEPSTVPLKGDVVYQGGGQFNLNGLASFGHWLVSGQTVTGNLYAIDPSTGMTKLIPLTDRYGNPTSVPGADGIAQRGNRLYIAQNFPNMIATVKVSRHVDHAWLVSQVTDPGLDIPSSVEEDRGDLYALNARFDLPTRDANTTYNVLRVGR